MNPPECRYTRGHTWVKEENGTATIGITSYAQEQLGAVLFVEVTEAGGKITQFQPCGVVESDKATSDIMSPVSGNVVAVNDEVVNAPELLNQDPYGAGWLLKVHLADRKELHALMTAEQFETYTAGGE